MADNGTQFRLPFWFHAFVVGSFAVAFLSFYAVRDRSHAAVARTLLDSMLGRQRPLLEFTPPATGRATEPASGSYRVNGMRVDFATVPAPAGIREVLRRFDRGFREAGYVTKMIEVQGQSVLVAVHPETRMLLTVRPTLGPGGQPAVRLSQQNLSELDSKIEPAIPGVPTFPGATGLLLVTQIRGPAAKSLQYATDTSPDWVSGFYETEMAAAGWSREVPPGAPASGVSMLFFTKGADECAVVVAPSPDGPGSLVMVTLTART